MPGSVKDASALTDGVATLASPKSRIFCLSPRGDEDVGRLDVAMRNSRLVRRLDHADVGMIQSRGGARFPLQPFQSMGSSGKIGGKKLQRHRARQNQVLSLVDHAHAALPQHT